MPTERVPKSDLEHELLRIHREGHSILRVIPDGDDVLVVTGTIDVELR